MDGAPHRARSGAGRRPEQRRRPVRRLGPLTAARRAPTTSPADDGRSGDPRRVPVWLPYVRGERVPFHDTTLRAALFDLDITDGPADMARAAYEASGFVVRSILERSGVTGRRIVASGGGTQLAAWMSGVADATGLPVDTVAVPEGAALGAAFLARMAAGLEPSLDGSRRWARRGERVDPRPPVAGGSRRPLPALHRPRAGLAGGPADRLGAGQPDPEAGLEGHLDRTALLLGGEGPEGVVPVIEREAVGQHARSGRPGPSTTRSR